MLTPRDSVLTTFPTNIQYIIVPMQIGAKNLWFQYQKNTKLNEISMDMTNSKSHLYRTVGWPRNQLKPQNTGRHGFFIR